MKLASIRNGKRDGRLAVVSRDLTRMTDASFLAPTLQAALDDWDRLGPHLAALADYSATWKRLPETEVVHYDEFDRLRAAVGQARRRPLWVAALGVPMVATVPVAV